MNKKISKVAVIAMMALSAFVTSSCLKNGENVNTIVANNFCTVGPGTSSRYTFYMDDDIVVRLDSVSENRIYRTFGSKASRISLIYQYNTQDATIVDGVRHVYNAEVLNGTQLVKVDDIMTTEIAKSKNQLAADSVFEIRTLQAFYAHKGYITCAVEGPYFSNGTKAAYPDINLIVDEKDIKENEMTIHLYYNCHANKKASGYYVSTFAKSFPITSYSKLVPGNSDITLKLVLEGKTGSNVHTAKMTRGDFYLPF